MICIGEPPAAEMFNAFARVQKPTMPINHENNGSEFDDLIRQVRAGSQTAAWQLIEKYSSKMLRVIRRNLPDILRQKFDSQDFVQAAWASVFAHRSRLVDCNNPQEFIGYLAAIATNKVKMEVRNRFEVQKRDVRRERSFDESAVGHQEHFASHAPTPEDIAIARERWFELVAGLPDRHRQIVEMSFMGSTPIEIAQHLGMHAGHVRRVLNQVFAESSAHAEA